MDDIDFHSLGLHTGSSASLLKYYQDKIRRFDEERKSQLQRIADIDVRSAVGTRWTSTAERYHCLLFRSSATRTSTSSDGN